MEKYITVDGPDGVGKTTVIKMLAKMLEEQGRKVMYIRGFGGGDLSSRIREYIFAKGKNNPTYEILGIPFCFLETMETEILPALKDDTLVIIDRWFLSYYAYQVRARDSYVARMIYAKELSNMTEREHLGLEIICTAKLETCEARLKQRSDLNYLDNEERAFRLEVHDAFDSLLDRHGTDVKNSVHLNCEGDLESVRSLVRSIATNKVNWSI